MATGMCDSSSSPELEPLRCNFSCSPCSKDGNSVDAVFRCIDCQENLCSLCLSYHQKFNSMRDHTITEGGQMEDSDEMKPPLLPKERCSKHHSRVTDMYCKDHNLVCCATCIANYHRDCQDVDYIPEVAEDMKDCKELTDTQVKLNEFTCEIKQLKLDREEDLKRIEEEKENIFQNISLLKEDIIKHFDELESKAIKEVQEQFEKYESKFKTDIKRLDEILESVEKNAKSLKDFTGDNESQLFVHVKNGQTLAEYFGAIKTEVEETRDQLRFEVDNKVQEYCNSLESIGHVVEFTPVSLTLSKKYNVKTKTDENTCDLSGCCFLEDGTLVIADAANVNINQLNKHYQVKCHASVISRPVDICSMGHNEVAVGLERHIQIAEVTDNIKLTSLICVGGELWGIDYHNEALCVSCEGTKKNQPVIKMFSKTGTRLQSISLPSYECDPLQILATGKRNQIVVADVRGQILMIDQRGTVLWRFSHEGLVKPNCVLKYDDITLLVIGSESHNIVQVALKGTQWKVLLRATDGLTSPYSMSYDKVSHRLVVVSDDKNDIAVYHINQEN